MQEELGELTGAQLFDDLPGSLTGTMKDWIGRY